MNSMNRTLPWLIAALLATAVVYWPGLQGAFIYDDITNFERLDPWLQGQIGWKDVVLEHTAGPLGRPLAMATFLANAGTTGMDPFYFKLTNLLLHLLIGLVVYAVILRLARRDPLLSHSPETLALVVSAIWLLHPMMVGTVLYVVQRMAMLSVLFMLLALLAYLLGRQRIETGQPRAGALWIWIGVPGFTLLAALSKENGLLAPLLCAVVEWVYYRPKSGIRRPAIVRAFLWINLALPALAGLILFILKPEFFLLGFENRPFSLSDRLLTESRVLFDYVGNVLVPVGPSMSLFRDDYRISTGLLSPWTTVFALGGWAFVLLCAVRLRDRIPAFSAGAGIFLSGHAMESSILPLMIYFEHRNYLPALGIFLAVAGVISYGYQKIHGKLTNPVLLTRAVVTAMLVVLSAATFARASLWGSNEAILRQSLERYPDAIAARLGLADLEMNRLPPDLTAAQNHYRHLLSLDRPSARLIGATGLIASSCYASLPPEKIALEILGGETPDTLESDFLAAITSLVEIMLGPGCIYLEPQFLARRLEEFTQHSSLPGHHVIIWQLRFRAAQLYENAGMLEQAEDLAMLAWQSTREQLPAAMLLLRVAILRGKKDTAQELILSIEGLLPTEDRIGQELLQYYRNQLGASK